MTLEEAAKKGYGLHLGYIDGRERWWPIPTDAIVVTGPGFASKEAALRGLERGSKPEPRYYNPRPEPDSDRGDDR